MNTTDDHDMIFCGLKDNKSFEGMRPDLCVDTALTHYRRKQGYDSSHNKR